MSGEEGGAAACGPCTIALIVIEPFKPDADDHVLETASRPSEIELMFIFSSTESPAAAAAKSLSTVPVSAESLPNTFDIPFRLGTMPKPVVEVPRSELERGMSVI